VNHSPIERTVRHENDGKVEVTVRARNDLTEGRWKSFGWEIISIEGPR
jgi:transketolase N-terminal domain/subunit